MRHNSRTASKVYAISDTVTKPSRPTDSERQFPVQQKIDNTLNDPNVSPAYITYMVYPFLHIGNLHSLLAQDVNYLESQCCFRVPTKNLLDEFLKQYFLHVHPLTPIIDEQEFWDIYRGRDTGFSKRPVSLLVFQAMLFSSCSFVSKEALCSLGFQNAKVAKASIYRRAKLLYDFQTESSSLKLAQASLLLSHWCPQLSSPGIKQLNSLWLSIAIRHAISVGAHHQVYDSTSKMPKHGMPPKNRRNLLRRLWWSCIIRDRTLALSWRRSLQILPSMGNMNSPEVIGFSELNNEVGASEVYNSGEKQQMIRIIESTAKLCVTMTNLILLLWPSASDDTSQGGKGSTIKETEIAIDQWYLECCARLSGRQQEIDRRNESPSHRWVQLHINSMIATYYCRSTASDHKTSTTKVALYQYQAFKAAITSPFNEFTQEITWVDVNDTYHDQLQDGILSATQKLVEISHHGMSQWIPAHLLVSAGTSLLVHILHTKMIDLKDYIIPLSTDEQAIKLRRQSLGALIGLLDIADDHHNDIQYILEPLRHFSRNHGLDTLLRKFLARKEEAQKSSSWIKTVFADARDYIHLQMILETTLSEGKLPESNDQASSLKLVGDNQIMTPESFDNSNTPLPGLSQGSSFSDAEQNSQSTSFNQGVLATQSPSLSDESPSPFIDWWFSEKSGTISPVPTQSSVLPELGIESIDGSSMYIPMDSPRIGSGFLGEIELKDLFADTLSDRSSPYYNR
ncbi:unnamed protein product [Clonostachys byssicola]|uniref:Xylanolytic transcriptional activator regulatory domain-containing protein n=1 Tax=Clonostachys byssicola TaxID=160290 RepID=A0A9N9UHF3_9HYPO|nr:unnamed protein product [Clonostachys byssicola]